MKSSSSLGKGGYGEGRHAAICRRLGTALALAKINYVRLFRLVELYQPMLVPPEFEKYIIRPRESARATMARYDHVVKNIVANHCNGGHLDVGCQFGAIPILLSQRGLFSIGVEYQYFSYLAAKELARINDAKFVHIVNADITKVMDELPVMESISMLSILHHIAHLFDDRDSYEGFLAKMLSRASRLVVIELATPDEGNFAWTRANRKIAAGGDLVGWHMEFLEAHGFHVRGNVTSFATHLGGERPVIVGDRSNDPDSVPLSARTSTDSLRLGI